MFSLNRDDLNFLLTQVTVDADYSQPTNALDPGGLREVSGSHNPGRLLLRRFRFQFANQFVSRK